MNNSIRLLERVRLSTPNKSKEQTAKALGIDRANLYRIYRGKGFPNPLHCMEISRITGVDLTSVLAYIQADKARSPEAKKAVSKKLPRLLSTAGLAFALAVGGIRSGIADAATVNSFAREGNFEMTPLYIMRSTRYHGLFGVRECPLSKLIIHVQWYGISRYEQLLIYRINNSRPGFRATVSLRR